MRNHQTCVQEAKGFLDELRANNGPLRSPKASTQARNWCKSHGFVKWKASGRNFDGRSCGWVLTQKGLNTLSGKQVVF